MCCKNFWSKNISFAMTFVLGLTIANYFQKLFTNDVRQEKLISENYKHPELASELSGADTGISIKTSKTNSFLMNKSVAILSKPEAYYTDAARQNGTQGNVTLRVTFLATSEIGNILTINSLPDGLTEQAISAAKQIKFESAKKDGIPVTVTKQLQYTFILY